MRYIGFVLAPALLTAAFWSTFSACITDIPDPHVPPAVDLVVSWDPALCGAPHRVVIELEADSGSQLSSSTLCAIGQLAMAIPELGVYRGRVFAWELGQPIRSITPVTMTLDTRLVRWEIVTPR
ncbi:MAG: hypothetical protein AB7P03_06315 [Kofleriaceae bacterium]